MHLVAYFLLILVHTSIVISKKSQPKLLKNRSLQTHCDSIQVFIEEENAKCIDGSKPAFYLRNTSSRTQNKWHIHFEGGGWCYELQTCHQRSFTKLGSSLNYPKCMDISSMGSYFSTDAIQNPMLHNYETVYVRYCDGSSYAGNADYNYKNKNLYFRGKYNRDATILSLLHHYGMSKASEVLISGCSAGALGIYLGIDHITKLIKSVNSTIIVKGYADSGYFMNYSSSSIITNNYQLSYDAIHPIHKNLDYNYGMKNIFQWMNITSGANQKCIKNNMNQRENCIFSYFLLPHITTPLFITQPLYDSWQIVHVLGALNDINSINSFGNLLKSQLTNTIQSSATHHGIFFDSCPHHCMTCKNGPSDTWNGKEVISVDGYSPSSALLDWYHNTKTKIYTQQGVYPCKNCCSCKF